MGDFSLDLRANKSRLGKMDQRVKHFHVCMRTEVRSHHPYKYRYLPVIPACRKETQEMLGSIRLVILAKFLSSGFKKWKAKLRRSVSVSLCPLYLCAPILYDPTCVNTQTHTHHIHIHARKLMSRNRLEVTEREISLQRNASWDQRDRKS